MTDRRAHLPFKTRHACATVYHTSELCEHSIFAPMASERSSPCRFSDEDSGEDGHSSRTSFTSHLCASSVQACQRRKTGFSPSGRKGKEFTRPAILATTERRCHLLILRYVRGKRPKQGVDDFLATDGSHSPLIWIVARSRTILSRHSSRIVERLKFTKESAM